MPEKDIPTDDMPSDAQRLQAQINFAFISGAAGLSGAMALVRELSAIIGEDGVDRVREAMLERVTGATRLPAELRNQLEREILRGTAKTP